MVLRNELKRPKRDSNYRTLPPPTTTTTLQNIAESTNDDSSLDSSYINQSTKTTVLTSSSCTTAKSAKTHSNFKKQLKEKALLNKQFSNVNTPILRPYEQYLQYRSINKEFSDSTSMGSDYCLPFSKRLSGGGTLARQQRDNLILSPSQCKLKPAGLEYLDPRNKVNILSLQLNVDEVRGSDEDLVVRPQPQKTHTIKKNRTRATQTLFRESSAQTLPYLPAISNNSEELQDLELLKLPAILPGDGPPGVYEVEVLERARRRWAFAKALKENLRKQFEAAKQLAKMQDHQHIIEAFEWEHWIEREEYIQECQMLRLELLIRMFDKREREMHEASKNRIQKSCEIIEAKRKASLKKNELEYNKALRRLERSHSKQPRVWRKEHITQELGDPSSEFYAPQMRYGVNPSRRHFTATHKGFDLRMDDLEKKAIKMDPENLKCPFAKLREWSKPKEVLQEVEQNFCSDSNLKKLYESLRTLRETTRIQKYIPACLKAKQPPKVATKEDSTVQQSIFDNKKPVESLIPSNAVDDDSSLDRAESFEELRQQKQVERLNREIIKQEMRFEELETLICSYEGNTIGWLMRFLSEEMSRLTEKRKLHFFTMMAKRTRWHREAAEAGLRQKENCVRETYEKLYKDCNKANREVTDKFLDSILSVDVKNYAHQMAEQDIVAKAKEIDKEIAGWLESFKEVQNPMNYSTLRHGLRDIIIPDVEKIIYRLERDRCIDFIVNDVLLFKVYSDLESYDISLAITNDFVDRLIDNDLYLNSPDCSSDCECLILECAVVCCCSEAKREVRAIVRKLIRHAVTGKRWRTEEERICDENVFDLLNEILDKVVKDNFIDVDIIDAEQVCYQGAHTDLVCSINDLIFNQRDDEPISYHENPDNVKLEVLDSECKSKIVDVTKSLRFNEQLLLLDPDCVPTTNDVLLSANTYTEPLPKPVLSKLRIIPSTHDLSNVFDFSDTPVFALTSSEELSTDEQIVPDLNYEMINEAIDELSIECEERIEGFQLEIEEEQEEEQQPEQEHKLEQEHKIAQEHEQEQEEKEKVKEAVKGSQKTVRLNEGPSEIIVDYEPPTLDEDNGLVRVSFTYDPNVKYSIPKPSDFDLSIDVDDDDEDDDADADDKISKATA